MVSFFRSHCHSASETFIGSACCCTRSITLRRTASSSSCSRSAWAVSSGLARRRMRCEAGGGEGGAATAAEPRGPPAGAAPPSPPARLHPLQPPHFFSATAPSADTRPRSWPRSTSTITASCSASGSSDGQVKYSLRFPLNRTSTIGVNSLLAQSTHRKVLLLSTFEQLLHLGLAEQAHMAAECVAQGSRGGVGVGAGAPWRLRNDVVDHGQLQQVFGRDLQGFGRPFPLSGVLPENRRTAFGRNHRIHRVFEHQHPIGESYRERPAGAPFTDDGGDDRGAYRRHLHQVAGDRFGPAPLLGAP